MEWMRQKKAILTCKVALGNVLDVTRGDHLVGLNERFHSKYASRHVYNEYVVTNASQAYCPYAVVYQDCGSCMLGALLLAAATSLLLSWLAVFALTSRVVRAWPPWPCCRCAS